MSDLPIKSPLKIELQAGSEPQLSFAGVSIIGPVDTVPEDGPVRDWFQELGLPKDWEQLDHLAQPRDFADRFARVIVVDESQTRFPGAWRFRPSEIAFQQGGCLLTLAHLGLVIGQCIFLHVNPAGAVPEAEGMCLTATVTFYDSDLATAAWRGIASNIFTHVSAIVVRPPEAPPGGGELIEIGLVDSPGCPGARVLRWWEA
mgnify:CR=1 FL=1